jgi:uncharacterized Tic20 family protein
VSVVRIEPPAGANERNWATIAHLCGLLWLSGFPFAGTVASSIVYATKHQVSPYVADQSREAQNFQNTISLAVIVVMVLLAGIVGKDLIGMLRTGQSDLSVGDATAQLWAIALAAFGLAAIMLFNLVSCIVAALAVRGGRLYRYPLCIRWLRV